MSNIDPTVLIQTPTRLILKIGDDLRQDMITLRMFSLFEKVSIKFHTSTTIKFDLRILSHYAIDLWCTN